MKTIVDREVMINEEYTVRFIYFGDMSFGDSTYRYRVELFYFDNFSYVEVSEQPFKLNKQLLLRMILKRFN